MGRINLTDADADKMAEKWELECEIEKGYWEQTGGPEKFKLQVARDQRARQRPECWGGVKR